MPQSTARSPLTPRYYDRTSNIGIYAQDDWKISQRLTVNLGLRYEYNTPVFDKYNIVSNFDPSTGGVVIPGQNNYPQGLWNNNKKDFGPRLGFAWQPFNSAKTVIRAGYGIYYNAPAVNNVVNGPQQSNAPYVSAQTLTSSYAVPLTLANPYPSAAATSGTLTLYGIDRNLPDAQIQQWSFSVQQQLSDSLALDLAYLGSKGTHLPLFYNTNQPLPQTGSVAQQQATRRFPQYGNIYFQDDVGNSSYNGLTAKLDKRYKNGLSFVVSYALGKSIDDTPGTLFNVSPSRSIAENPLNFRMDRGLSGFDIRNRFVFSPVYDLPFGRGKMFVNGGGLGSALIGGWEISGILTLQSGPPFTALVNSYRSQSLAQVDRPNVIGNGNNGAQTVSQWFNTSAFALSPLGTYGNEGRNNLTGPPLKNLDIVLSRNFRIKERVGLQFRAEAFNIANHPNFGLPDQTFEDPSFGALTSTSTDPRELQVALKIKF